MATSSTNGALVGNVKDLLGAASNTQPRKTGSDMGKDAFLQLLVSQLKNQDPMSPMDNTQFISQMAQFSSLEQMQNLNQTMSAQSAFQSLSNASGMIGKYVSLVNTTDSGTSGTITGKVDEVRQAGGKVSVIIGGQAYDAGSIEQVSSSPISQTDAQAAASAAQAAAAQAAASSTSQVAAITGSSTTSGGTTSTTSSPAASSLSTTTPLKYSLKGLGL